MTATEQLLHPLVGQRIPGGCDDCDAYQELYEVAPGLYLLGICHDDWCPELQLKQRR